MADPGEGVKDEADYKKLPADKRDHWENGRSKELTQAQKDKLAEECAKAGKYDRKSKSYSDDFPTAGNGKPDHGAILRNAKQYVHDKLAPAKDVEGKTAPARPLGGMIDQGGTPDSPLNPPDNPDNKAGEPAWVCINHAEYLAAIMRCLGYPVREVNVKLSKWSGFLWLNQTDYQEAAVQVWFAGKWHFADPFHCKFDPACLLETYSTYTRWLLYIWDGTTPPPDYQPVPNDGKKGGWLREKATGNDLQKRFYSLAPPVLDPQSPLIHSDGWQLASVYAADPAPSWIPGVVIAPGPEGEATRQDVTFSVVNEEGQTSDGVRADIPGVVRSVGGSLVPFVMGLTSPDEQVPNVRAGEFVFVGATSLIPRASDIGTTSLTLLVHAPAGATVPLTWSVARSEYPVTIDGLPDEVTGDPSGPVPIPIRVTIDPADPDRYMAFRLLHCRAGGDSRPECDCHPRCVDDSAYQVWEDYVLGWRSRQELALTHLAPEQDPPLRL